VRVNIDILISLVVDLLVAYEGDPAGHNMAQHLVAGMKRSDTVYSGSRYDLVEIPTPTIEADWLEQKYRYDSYVFLSKHAAKSGKLALTCHSTGNFATAELGGQDRHVSVPHPQLQKRYMRMLYEKRDEFADFDITIEATHHGPTELDKPSIFVEVGTTPSQWEDADLCSRVADILDDAMNDTREYAVGICFGGTHYPHAFTRELIHGEFALGTVVPRRDLVHLDDKLLAHILEQNAGADVALLDWDGMGPHKSRITKIIKDAGLEIIRL